MGFLLLIPFFLVRFTLLGARNREAVAKAAHFPPLGSGERPAYWVYQISTTGIVFCILILRVKTEPAALFFFGLFFYLMGLIFLAASVIDFAAPVPNGFHQNGVYRFSRNPMYIAYFVLFLGCVLLTQSLPLLGFLATFQLSTHWIILAEERWCADQFGEEYLNYRRQVPRYVWPFTG